MLRLQVDEVALTHPPLKSRTSGGSNACRLLPIEQTRRSSSRTPDSASFMPMRDSADRLVGQSTTFSGGNYQHQDARGAEQSRAGDDGARYTSQRGAGNGLRGSGTDRPGNQRVDSGG